MLDALATGGEASRQASEALLEFVLSAPLGTRVPAERELAARFGVSRTTVRSAIDRLALLGFLVVRHGAGTVTARPSPERLVSPFAAALSLAGYHTPADTLAVRRILEPHIAARAARSDARDAALGLPLDDDAALHVGVARLAADELAATLVAVLVTLSAVPLAGGTGGAADATMQRQHKAIATAIAEGDVDLARDSMLLHLRWHARALRTP